MGVGACIFEGRGKSRDFGSLPPTNRGSLGSTGTKIRTRVTWGCVAFEVGRICVVAVWDTGTKIRTRVTWGVCYQQIVALLVARVLKFIPA